MTNTNIEDRYKKLTHTEHILTRPETYIGSIHTDSRDIFLPINCDNFENLKMEYRTVSYSPGFLKIFDEIITNASDHAIRTGLVSHINVNITNDTISVENDGGIPVVMHSKEKMYVPELIFGNLLTGENYTDTEVRFVGGRNGYGAKLTNIYSKSFIVETADGKKEYFQKFSSNMSKMNKPKIKKSKKNYTKITYVADFEKFEMTEIDGDMLKILTKRVIDIAAYNPTVKVSLNGNLIPIRSFNDYMKLFLQEDDKVYYEKINEFLEIGITKSPTDMFTHVSMVNGISTTIGGSHVNHVTNTIVSSIKDIITKANKGINIRPNDIRNRFLVFINCKVPNPIFDNQTKENLTSKLDSTIRNITINEPMLKRISKSDILADLVELSMMKDKIQLEKDMNKVVTKRVKVEKLVDANKAGKVGDSQKCHLFLTEGDSARTLAIAGFSQTGRDFYGAFPLKGKPLNVRDTTLAKIKNNDEIKNIIQILGLEFGRKYRDTKSLRYGKVVIMSDADTDGYHIKGLIVNLFNVFWPELLKLDFMYEFVTPILKVTKGKTKKFFYRISDYEKWLKLTDDGKGYRTKYYKGLGTIEGDVAKMLFKKIDKHLIKFNYKEADDTDDVIDMVFRKKRAEDRKKWLLDYKPDNIVNKFNTKTTYGSFFENEFIEFSMADNIRSIPSIVDGLKPSQRKILFTLFNLKNKGEINVGELFGFVKAGAAYHHGPKSLDDGIINMAQDYVGSNNISLIEPIGGFGTRLSGGKDASAARYINTELRAITKTMFMPQDNQLLTYLNDDGKDIEPKFYVPNIPIVLMNGTEGIGTGWSTFIPKFKIEDLITYIDNKLSEKKTNIELEPYYEGFKGTIEKDVKPNAYITTGKIEKVNTSTVVITELPIGTWNDPYYLILDDMIDEKIIKSYTKNCTDKDVNIVIKIARESLENLTDENLYSMFKLTSRLNTTNMYLFDENSKIKKYDTQYEIIDEYFYTRLAYYGKRKRTLIENLKIKLSKLDNFIKFITYVIEGKIVINNKSMDSIIKNLEKYEFEMIEDSYNYLLSLPLYRLSKEELEKLNNSYKDTASEIIKIEKTTIEQMWHQDLIELKKEVRKFRKAQ